MTFFDISTLLQICPAICIVAFVVYYKWRFTYWKNKRIPGPKPSIPFGNSQNPFARKSTGFENIKIIYDQMNAQKEKHCGIYIFATPSYLLIDPEYIKNIAVRDFSHFVDRGMYHNEKDDPLSAHLLSLEGDKWKNLRAKLTPTFTSGKMRMMFNSFLTCADQMLEAMHELDKEHLDIKEICACYTTDVIGTCAFGLDCNSFEKEAEFRKFGKKAMHPSLINIIRIVFCTTFKSLAKMLGTRMIDPEASNFFLNAIRTTIQYREDNNVSRNDFLQLAIELKRENMLTVEEIAAQAFIFFLAGFETSSTTMYCCLYELSKDEDVQDKLREEIEEVIVKNGGKLTYESIGDMKYLNQVIEETLRMYPPIPQIQRTCTKEYKLPEHDAVLEKGMRVIFPIFAMHYDPKYFANPEKFDPDRFTDENKVGRHPFAYLPFGEGPRICIGKRFGLMQVKVGLITLLRNYKLKLNPKTKTPIQFDRDGILLTVKNTIWLDSRKI